MTPANSYAVRGGESLPRPLFDKFRRGDDGQRPAAALSLEGYRSCIVRDIESLLNTRSPQPLDADEKEYDGVIGYGMPDLSHLCPESDDDLREAARAIRRTLERYESRLRDIAVDAAKGCAPGTVAVTVTARLAITDAVFTGEFFASFE